MRHVFHHYCCCIFQRTFYYHTHHDHHHNHQNHNDDHDDGREGGGGEDEVLRLQASSRGQGIRGDHDDDHYHDNHDHYGPGTSQSMILLTVIMIMNKEHFIFTCLLPQKLQSAYVRLLVGR